MPSFNNLKNTDEEIYNAIEKELDRQRNKIELIASENFVSKSVMEAMGSYMTNKYAEGYPDHRYYGGCEYVDIAENLAIERAKKIFGAEHANVQPHSGAQANMAVYFALLEPGDTVLGMNLAHGGHLTHGSKVNASGKLYNFIPYGVDKDTGRIDYDELERIAIECKPKLILAGASAYPREIDFKRIKEIADKTSSIFMVDMAHIAGLVAAGLHQNPVEYADIVTTTTHKTLRGPRGGMILCKEKYGKAIDKGITGKELEERLDNVGITVNKNAVPFDTEKPMITSGIRIGTPAVTTRGFKEEEMKKIAKLINLTVDEYDSKKEEIRQEVSRICEKYPLYE